MISEFMPKNDGFLQDGQRKSPDWIELFNSGDEAVNPQGYRFTDTPDNLSRSTLPNQVLRPGQYLVVWASGNDFVDNRELCTRISTLVPAASTWF